MLQIYICVGSSCHLKGSYQIVRIFGELIEKNGLQGKVELKASFCLGHCTKGVAAKIDGEFVEDLDINNAAEIFEKFVVEKVRRGQYEHNSV